MAQDNTGGPAFPVVDPKNDVSESGMTLRDYFAGQALAAMIGKSPFFDRDGEFGKSVDMVQFKMDMSESAYAYADAMLKAREVSE